MSKPAPLRPSAFGREKCPPGCERGSAPPTRASLETSPPPISHSSQTQETGLAGVHRYWSPTPGPIPTAAVLAKLPQGNAGPGLTKRAAALCSGQGVGGVSSCLGREVGGASETPPSSRHQHSRSRLRLLWGQPGVPHFVVAHTRLRRPCPAPWRGASLHVPLG